AIEPDIDIAAQLKTAKQLNGRQSAQTALGEILPKRLAQFLVEREKISGNMADLPDKTLLRLAASAQNLAVKPSGSEGYRTAEVTLGGIDTTALDSRSMEAKAVPGLYFIGECVDVTGWLGGYNF
ncbi:aminoacetone oxidase family FAD-binding enzyme, partial [Pseudomonas sp. BGM005]|nr:aminoacetone oxidase family FAD-binding enzyme [Pseudomonas sp. BG5]